jgi:hypothetical protein
VKGFLRIDGVALNCRRAVESWVFPRRELSLCAAGGLACLRQLASGSIRGPISHFEASSATAKLDQRHSSFDNGEMTDDSLGAGFSNLGGTLNCLELGSFLRWWSFELADEAPDPLMKLGSAQCSIRSRIVPM